MIIPEDLPKSATRKQYADLLHLSVTSIRNAEKKGMPSFHPDSRKTIIHRRDILDYFCGGWGY